MRNLFSAAVLALAVATRAYAGAVFIPIVIPIPVQVPAPEKGGYSKIHTVAVLSGIGVTLKLRNNHFVGPKTGSVDIADWKIDDVVTSTIRQYLGNRWTIRALNDQQRSILHTYVTRLITTSLIETLRSLELGVALPEPGARTLVPIPRNRLPYKNLGTVAVVSGIGDEINLERIDTIFSHSSDFVPVQDWQIDSAVEKRAAGILAKRFSIKEVAVDRAAFDGATLLDDKYKLDPKFPGLEPNTAIDAYIAFIKLVEPVGGLTSAKQKGLGMWVNGAAETHILFANYAVAVIDAHTLKVIAAHTATTSPAQPLRGQLAVPADLWPGHPPVFTPQRTEAFKSALSGLVDDTVDETLLTMGLAGMMPADTPPPAPAPGTTP